MICDKFGIKINESDDHVFNFLMKKFLQVDYQFQQYLSVLTVNEILN